MYRAFFSHSMLNKVTVPTTESNSSHNGKLICTGSVNLPTPPSGEGVNFYILWSNMWSVKVIVGQSGQY
jgi:hypothetical protein